MAVPAGGFRNAHVLRLGSLGDIILTLPTVAALRRAWPDARLTYWVKEEFADLVRHDPALTHIRVLERDGRRIEDLISMSAELEDADLIVDLHANLRTRVLTFRQRSHVLRTPSYRLTRSFQVRARWLARKPPPTVLERHASVLARLGIAPDGPPRMHAGPEAERWARDYVSTFTGPGPLVAMIPGAAHATKRWPERHWIDLHRQLREAGMRTVYFGLEDDRKRVPTLAAKVALDDGARWCIERLPRVAALLSHCVTAVAGDTGLMHLATARGVRVVAMYGSTAPELGFPPSGAGHAVLCRHEPCQPCTIHGRANCPKRHFRCMVDLTPDQVAGEARRIVVAG